MMKKRLFIFGLTLCATLLMWGQGVKPLPTLHVEGKWLVDEYGNHVVLHGVMDTPSAWFNGGRWGWNYDDAGRQRCLDYFEKLYTGLEKAKCTVFRLHLEPAWTNDNSYTYQPAVIQSTELPEKDKGGERDIRHFNPTRLTNYLKTLYFPLMQKAMKHGMYVVVRPPGVCPQDLKVGDYYQKYLMTVWNLFTQNDSIRKYAGQISIELANEPVNLKNASGQDDKKAMHDYFQPIVDKIRANGFMGIVWVPGTGYQSSYADYKTYPITGHNIGYAVHDYNGWYGCDDKKLTEANLEQAKKNKINQFHNQVPVIDTNPIIITEIDWSPERQPLVIDHYNEFNQPVYKSMGTWATATTSKWGTVYKAVHDYYGNISMTLSGTGCLIDVDKLINTGKVEPAFDGHEEACGKACMDWYAEWYNVNYPHANFQSVPVSDFGKSYQNPIVRADFPDPDVIRVGDTYYMVSTTMYHFPGATILKSQDMVNWEYCAHPLKQLSKKDDYDLLKNSNAYASGMWACSMKYHNGKFYILINERLPVDNWELQGWLLTATNPEGEWTMKKLSRSYYDPGMLFDDGKVYVACGIGNISMCELDEDFNFKQEKTVISDKDKLEGSHLYKIGDYYYIYATYGGDPSGQTVFRSKNIFGPYEEKMVVEKSYGGVDNTIHQGALVEDVAGKWWTVMQEDLGAMGRMPNLQPVKWVNEWPVVGNNGKPYESFVSMMAKPAIKGDNGIKRLPTTDAFRSYALGMQWEWNHNPDNTAWSLTERPSWLRLKTTATTQKLPQARNMLTQRIFANKSKASTGTVRLDASNLAEGDRAGICILQDPYAMIAVEKKDGKLRLLWQKAQVKDAGENFKAAQETADIELPEDNIIYLRASMKYGENKAKFQYSTDNKQWTSFGGETPMWFNLSVFVGARFGLFCYATKQQGGYADFDWFTTEADFDEAATYPEDFTAPTAEMNTVTQLSVSNIQRTVETLIGYKSIPVITATYADKHTDFVNHLVEYTPEEDGIVEFYQGQMLGVGQGSTDVKATYTDLFGNKKEASFTAISSYFPFDYPYVTDKISGSGTYKKNVTNSVFKFSKNGQMGWVYESSIDMSAYRFLVIKMPMKQTADAHLNIYTTEKLTGNCYSSEKFGDKQEVVIDLQQAKYTSSTNKGKPLETNKVRMVTFTGANDGKLLTVSEMFLSNDPKYDTTGIIDANLQQDYENPVVDVYTLSGLKVRKAISRQEALKGLPAGIYVVGGRKMIVR